MFGKQYVAIFALALATGAGATQTASATTVQWTVTGTVSYSQDLTGLFGAPGGTLDGQTFMLTYLFDTALGVRSSIPQPPSDQVNGGTAIGATSPTLSARLEIAGHTQTISGARYSYYTVCDGSGCGLNSSVVSWIEHETSDPNYINYGGVSFGASAPVGAVTANLDAPFVLSNTTGVGNFSFINYNFVTQSYDAQTFGSLNVTNVSSQVVGVAPVPLPAAGLALIAGLGGLGLVGRRRRG